MRDIYMQTSKWEGVGIRCGIDYLMGVGGVEGVGRVGR